MCVGGESKCCGFSCLFVFPTVCFNTCWSCYVLLTYRLSRTRRKTNSPSTPVRCTQDNCQDPRALSFCLFPSKDHPQISDGTRQKKKKKQYLVVLLRSSQTLNTACKFLSLCSIFWIVGPYDYQIFKHAYFFKEYHDAIPTYFIFFLLIRKMNEKLCFSI